MRKLELKDELVNPAELKPSEINPNTMTDNQFEDLKKRMRDYGEPNVPDPVFITNDNTIIGGHHRVKAALELEWKTIRATKVINDLTKEERLFLQQQHNKHGKADDRLLREYYAELQLMSDMNKISYELEVTDQEVKNMFEVPNLEESDKQGKLDNNTITCPKCGFEIEKY